ncbi:MAG TPA: hypothetical protein VGR90_06600 [Acidimicrobiales bacterium]|nr:hypothetical protein [Acidimicrobiales bacterium]
MGLEHGTSLSNLLSTGLVPSWRARRVVCRQALLLGPLVDPEQLERTVGQRHPVPRPVQPERQLRSWSGSMAVYPRPANSSATVDLPAPGLPVTRMAVTATRLP